METAWIGDLLALTVTDIDFLDPALVGTPDVRERGVRLELRPVEAAHAGSVYASPSVALAPGVVRVDLLESGPGRADRMHWHPEMSDGEPGDRAFDKDMPEDPQGWLTRFLRSGLRRYLSERGHDVTAYAGDLGAIGAVADEVGRALAEGLVWARVAWPDVEHDHRGMAITSG